MEGNSTQIRSTLSESHTLRVPNQFQREEEDIAGVVSGRAKIRNANMKHSVS